LHFESEHSHPGFPKVLGLKLDLNLQSGTITIMKLLASVFTAALLLLAMRSFPSAQRQEDTARFLIFEKGKAGYIDANGNVVIPPQYTTGTEFDHGRACVYMLENGKMNHHVIDMKGNEIPERIGDCHGYPEDLAAVGFTSTDLARPCIAREQDCMVGFVDRNGNAVIRPRFQAAKNFSEGFAAVETNNKWGFINSSGELAIPFQFDFASSFSNGLALVLIKDRYGYIDHSGKLVIAAQFPQASRFSDGLAVVRKRGYFAEPFGEHAGTKKEQHTDWDIIGTDGHTQFRVNAERVDNFSEGMGAFQIVKRDGYLYCGYLDKSGNQAIPAQFGSCDEFSEGMAGVLLDGKYRFIDKTGRIALTLSFSEVRPFHNGLAWVFVGDPSRATGNGYIDKTGNVVWISKQ
jgi:WG containing repeat